jgi:hypothetical protein
VFVPWWVGYVFLGLILGLAAIGILGVRHRARSRHRS